MPDKCEKMHIDKLRTFLEVAATGNFYEASINLNVTQSTVSARIKTLEDRLRQKVFIRNPDGVSLTPAGLRLQRHAINIVRLWQRADQDAALPDTYKDSVGLGTVNSLSDSVLLPWVTRMRERAPELAIHAQADFSSYLMRQLIDGVLDIAVMYEPRHTPGFVIEEFIVDNLILVTTRTVEDAKAWREGYVFVDWGESFRQTHEKLNVDSPPPVHFGVGPPALQYILQNGGSGFFPTRMIRRYEDDGTLQRVPKVDEIHRTGYLVYNKAVEDSERIRLAIQVLREVKDDQG